MVSYGMVSKAFCPPSPGISVFYQVLFTLKQNGIFRCVYDIDYRNRTIELFLI